MNIKLLNDRVLVLRIGEEEKTAGGLIIPDPAKEKPQHGTVIIVGPEKNEDGKLLPLHVKAPDRVLFGKYAGNKMGIDGAQHLIMREYDILAVFE